MIFVDYPGFIIAAGLFALFAGLIWFAYRTQIARKAGAWRWILAFLQYAAVILIALIIWNPSKSIKTSAPQKNTVLAFFDTSQSMSIKDSDNMSRLNNAIEIFHKIFGPGIPDHPEYRIIGFDDDCYNCESVRSLNRWGSQTNLRAVFKEIEKHLPTQNEIDSNNGDENTSGAPIGAIIFTDGQAETKSLDLYKSIIPIHLKSLLWVWDRMRYGKTLPLKRLKPRTKRLSTRTIPLR